MNRIALIGENSIEYVEKMLDVWNEGGCVVLIDCQIPPKVVADMILETRVGKCYVEDKYYEKIYNVCNKKIEVISYVSKSTIAQLLPIKMYEIFQENYSSNEAVIIYSSGTTGKSKGIILSHFAINTNADAIIDYMQPADNDCMYIVKKLTHSSSIVGELLVALKRRIPLLIAQVVVPPRCVLHNIEKYCVTIIGVNPLLLSMYCDEFRNREYNISSLKKIYVSGAILNDKTYLKAQEVFNKQEVYNVYGLSEAGPRVAAQKSDCCRGNSVGKAIRGVEIVIVDELKNIVENKEYGVVHVNTPSVFIGYVSGRLKHKSLYKNWLNTGDIGYFDEYDELHIIGRIDDMIIIDAHKVYPSEVEQCIYAFSDIEECVVTRVSLCNKDILCCLYVSCERVRRDIRTVLCKVLMKHEIPQLFVRTEAIPRTQNGKVSLDGVKKVINQEIARGIGGCVLN